MSFDLYDKTGGLTPDEIGDSIRNGLTPKSLAELSGYTGMSEGDTAYLSLGVRSGDFIWTIGDFSAEVAADTLQGVYVASDTIASTVGCWVRKLEGYVTPGMFGDCSVSNSEIVINRCVETAYALNIKNVRGDRDEYEVQSPIKPMYGVSIDFLGANIRNTRPSYSFINSACLSPGNFHPSYTEKYYGASSSEAIPIDTAGKTSTKVSTSTISDASLFSVGDLVWVFTSSYYTSGAGQKIPEYAALAEVTDVNTLTGEVFLNRSLSIEVSGYIVNISNTSVTGANGDPLNFYGSGVIENFSVETDGLWISDSATLNATFRNFEVKRSRTAIYGNTYQITDFYGFTGRFDTSFLETSHNSERVNIYDFDMSCDPDLTASTPTYLMSLQENARSIKVTDGDISLSGFTGSQGIMRALNCTGARFKSLKLRGSPTFNGQVINLVNTSASGRVDCTDNKWEDINWEGPCSRYLYIEGDVTTKGNKVTSSKFTGPVATSEAIRINTCNEENEVVSCHFDDGRLYFGPGVVNQNIHDTYIDGGVQTIDSAEDSPWIVNTIRNISYKNTKSRKLFNFTDFSYPSLTTTTSEFVNVNTGIAALRPLDVVDVDLRVSVSGTSGTKTLSVKLNNGTTDLDLATWVIGASEIGVGWMSIKIFYMTSTNVIVTGSAVISGVEVYFNKVITSGIFGNTINYIISGVLADAGDACNIRNISSRISNPVLL